MSQLPFADSSRCRQSESTAIILPAAWQRSLERILIPFSSFGFQMIPQPLAAAGWPEPIYSAEQLQRRRLRLRALCRALIAAIMFGPPMGLMTMASPVIRRTVLNDPKLAQQLVLISIGLCSPFAAISYGLFIDRPSLSLVPQLDPLRGAATAALTVCCVHAIYPGMFVLMFEKGWQQKLRCYGRMTAKVFTALYPVHLPFPVLWGGALGLLCFPAVNPVAKPRV
jgi:hypothetical protein